MPDAPALHLTAIDSHAHVFSRGLNLARKRRYAPSYDAPLGDYLLAWHVYAACLTAVVGGLAAARLSTGDGPSVAALAGDAVRVATGLVALAAVAAPSAYVLAGPRCWRRRRRRRRRWQWWWRRHGATTDDDGDAAPADGTTGASAPDDDGGGAVPLAGPLPRGARGRAQ